MKHFKYAPLAIMLSIIPQVQAEEDLVGRAFIPQAYMKVPFGGVSHEQEKITYGFSIKQNSSFSNKHRPMFNLEFRGEELESVNINGMNVLEKRVVYGANGSSETVGGINWEMVAWGVVGVTAAAHYACVYQNETSMKWAGFGDDCKDEKGRAAAVS